MTATITVLADPRPHKVGSSRVINRSPEAKASRAAYYRASKRAMTRTCQANPALYRRFLTEELGSERDYRGKR